MLTYAMVYFAFLRKKRKDISDYAFCACDALTEIDLSQR